MSYEDQNHQIPRLLTEAFRCIDAITDYASKHRVEEALRLSYESDNERAPFSAGDITATTAIDPEHLARLNILLDKKRVVQYLEDIGAVISLPSMRKRLTAASYVRYFDDGREAVQSGPGGRLLLTYAESRYFAGIKGSFSIPAALMQKDRR